MGFIKFLGTAGARFVMIKQLRSSAGIWINYRSTNIMLDPGPGALLRCNSSRPRLDPVRLDGLILTHKHLDHSGDINVMIEAMTAGGFKKRVVFKYLEGFPAEVIFLKRGRFKIKELSFEVPIKNKHPVETYGLRFYFGNEIVSFLSDTEYFEDLVSAYKGTSLLVLNVVFYEKRQGIEHLCLAEALGLVKKIKPQKAIFTHFGMTMLKNKPHLLEKKIQEETGLNIQFAYDGLTIDIPE